MPPRLLPARTAHCCTAPLKSQPSSIALAAAHLARLSLSPTQTQTQTRHASILGRLAPPPGSVHTKKRVGRGPSSGHGKTSGRGHKGQGQHGHVRPWFQGGQTSLMKKHGVKGFVNLRAPEMSVVNLDQLQDWINQGRLDPSQQITPRELIKSGLIGRASDGIKLLSRGSELLAQPVDIMVSRASASAISAIEAAGGKITTRYYTKLAIQRLLRGESDSTDVPLPQGKEHVAGVLAAARARPFRYRLPDPTSRRDIEYYRDPAHRGYLMGQLKDGESPSLYFKVPGVEKVKTRAQTENRAEAETMW